MGQIIPSAHTPALQTPTVRNSQLGILQVTAQSTAPPGTQTSLWQCSSSSSSRWTSVGHRTPIHFLSAEFGMGTEGLQGPQGPRKGRQQSPCPMFGLYPALMSLHSISFHHPHDQSTTGSVFKTPPARCSLLLLPWCRPLGSLTQIPAATPRGLLLWLPDPISTSTLP